MEGNLCGVVSNASVELAAVEHNAIGVGGEGEGALGGREDATLVSD